VAASIVVLAAGGHAEAVPWGVTLEAVHVGAAAVWAVGSAHGSTVLVVLANIGFLLNAFDLLPIGFLDGGHALEAIREAWRMPVVRFEGGVPMQAFAPDRTRALQLAALYVGLAGAIVLGLLATKPNGML